MPKKTAFLFPGQGSQAVGMGKEWADAFPAACSIFEKADRTLGRSLSRICFEGPEDELKLTGNAQPGLYVCGVVGAALLAEHGVRPDTVTGHSLGEYSALAAAGVFDWETGLRLVRVRGEAMNAAAEASKGTMAAILGLEDEQVIAACKSIPQGRLVNAANFNGPGQVVISGELSAVEAAVEACKTVGARRAILLPVHGAFHSPLMESAVLKLKAALAHAKLSDPAIAFVANVTGDFMTQAEIIRESLARQITSCVRWTDTMRRLLESGVELFVEVGPGNVLSGIVKRMNRNAACVSCATPADLHAVVAAYRG